MFSVMELKGIGKMKTFSQYEEGKHSIWKPLPQPIHCWNEIDFFSFLLVAVWLPKSLPVVLRSGIGDMKKERSYLQFESLRDSIGESNFGGIGYFGE